MLIDRPFPAAFEFQVLDELPGSDEARFYLPGGSTTGGRDGPAIRLTSADGSSWLGIFAFGDFGRAGFTGIFTMPDPHRLCIVMKGAAYVADARSPGFCEELAFGPVTDLRVAPKQGLLVFAGLTGLIALGRLGTAWSSARIGCDDLTLTGMDEDRLYGTCYDLRDDSHCGFTVDLATGAHSGGSYPSSLK